MAGIRGVKNPIPQRGGQPTGMFSSKGKQKMDPCGHQHAGMTAAKYDKPRKGPVARDNRIKGQ